MIAALYVQTGGCYCGLEDVDPWDEERDARLYAGPWPVIAHPPCQRWGRYYHGGPSWLKAGNPPKILGDDEGCFSAALAAVRKWGGVLEHPKDSKAWDHFGIRRPRSDGGWYPSGDGAVWSGLTCCVEQGHYGHLARKPTWLYAVGLDQYAYQLSGEPHLIWGPSVVEGRTTPSKARGMCERLSSRQRQQTPPAFRDLLIELASTTRREGLS